MSYLAKFVGRLREEIIVVKYLVHTGCGPHSTPIPNGREEQSGRIVKLPYPLLRDYECEIFYLHFTMHLHDILRRHKELCWELLRKSRAKSSQHSQFSIAVSLNNLKSHQTGWVNGFLFGT